jgi:hypothetical protein
MARSLCHGWDTTTLNPSRSLGANPEQSEGEVEGSAVAFQSIQHHFTHTAPTGLFQEHEIDQVRL